MFDAMLGAREFFVKDGRSARSGMHGLTNVASFFLGWMPVVLLAVAAWPAGAQGTSTAPHTGKSADEVARELANPNNSLASLTFKNQFRSYTGSFPGADDQENYTLLFQPVFPFPLKPTENGGTVARPTSSSGRPFPCWSTNRCLW